MQHRRMVAEFAAAVTVAAVTLGGLAWAGAQSEEREPYVNEAVEVPDKPTEEDAQRAADADYARISDYAEKTGLVPVAGYVNEAGETIAYVRKTDLVNRADGTVDLVTIEGTVIGDFGNGVRPSKEAVEAAVRSDAE